MANKYHISSSGKPGICRAKYKCRLGGSDEHFSSIEESRLYLDKINEMKVESEEELTAYYSGNLSTDDLGKSSNPISRIEAYNNGYQNDHILNEDYVTKKGLVNNGLYSNKLIADEDNYISSKALENYNKENKIKLSPDTVDNIIQDKINTLKDNPDNEDLRTEIAYLNKYKNNSLSSVDSQQSEVLKDVAEPDGGATFNPITGKSPVVGFCYSPYSEQSKTVEFTDDLEKNTQMFLDYAKENKELLEKDNHYIGLWNDPATGIVYMDVSINTMDSKEARIECEQNDQIAYFDLQSFESVTVNSNATSGQKIDLKAEEENYFKDMEEEGIFSESLSSKINNTTDKDLDDMFQYFN